MMMRTGEIFHWESTHTLWWNMREIMFLHVFLYLPRDSFVPETYTHTYTHACTHPLYMNPNFIILTKGSIVYPNSYHISTVRKLSSCLLLVLFSRVVHLLPHCNAWRLHICVSTSLPFSPILKAVRQLCLTQLFKSCRQRTELKLFL